MRKKNIFFDIFTGCLMLTVLLLCGCAPENDLVIETGQQTEVAEEVVRQPEVTAEVSEALSSESAVETGPDVIYVQVLGAVHSPGVYELPTGSRVFEAVQKAGGMTDEAAPQSLNQAQELADGQMIVLYTQAEWEQLQETGGGTADVLQAEPDDGRVNINTAGIEELCTISGIGQSRAESIVTYREQNGAFESIEDIMKVSGIKEGLFQKIKDKIKV